MKKGSVIVYPFTMGYVQGARIEYFSRTGNTRKKHCFKSEINQILALQFH